MCCMVIAAAISNLELWRDKGKRRVRPFRFIQLNIILRGDGRGVEWRKGFVDIRFNSYRLGMLSERINCGPCVAVENFCMLIVDGKYSIT